MDDRQAFMNAIIADIDNDLPRLVFADWLEEHGEPDRAEFIRVQCELASLPADAPHHPRLAAREGELLGRYGYEWAEEFKTDFNHFVYRRGFIERVQIWLEGTTAARLLEVFRRQPIRYVCDVRRSDVPVSFADALAELPEGQITGLELRELDCSDADTLRQILTAPALGCLRTLIISSFRRPPRAELLAEVLRSRSCRNLEVFGVDSGLWYRTVPVPECVEAICDSPYLSRLQSLFLSRLDTSSYPSATPSELLERLGRSSNLTALRHLDLHNTSFSEEGIRAILGWPFLARLERLWFAGSGMRDAGELALLPEWKEAFDAACPNIDWTTSFGSPWNCDVLKVQAGLDWLKRPQQPASAKRRKA